MITQDIVSRVSRRAILAAGIGLIALLVVATVVVLAVLRSEELARAERHLGNLAMALSGQTWQTVHTLEILGKTTATELQDRQSGKRSFSDPELLGRMKDRIAALPNVRMVAFVDRQGRPVLHAPEPAPGNANFADREHFRVHLARRIEGLYIGVPVFGKVSAEWLNAFSCRVEDERGELRGVVFVAARMGSFENMFEALDLGVGGHAFLFRDDGALLAVYPHDEKALGRSFAHDPLFRADLKASARGIERRRGILDDEPRVVAYSRLEGYPLVVTVSSTEQAILAQWRRDAWQIGAGAAGAVIFVAVALFFLLRQARVSAALRRDLDESGLRLQGIIQSAMDAVITVDDRQNIVLFNSAAEQIFRCPAAEAIGGPLDRFIPERYRAAHREHIERFGRTGASTRMMGARLELYGLRANGEEFPIDASISQLGADYGRYFTVILRDITERKRADDALRESQSRLAAERTALARLNEATSRLWHVGSLHEGLEEMLAATIEMMGADMGNVQILDGGKGVLVIAAHRGFRQDFLDFFREVSTQDDSACGRALRSGERIVIEDVETDEPFAPLRPIARAAGYRSVQSTPLIGRNGAPLGMISTHWRSPRRPSEIEMRLLDVYARQAADFIEDKQGEAALQAAYRERREAEERVRGIFESAMDAIVTVDDRQNIVLFNAAAETIFGCRAEDAIGRPLDRFIPERFRAAHREHIRRFGATRVTTRMMGGQLALYGLRANGEEFPIDASISQITVGGKRLFTVILRDITRRKQAEEAIARSHEELRELAAKMHEVREAERLRVARELHDELAQWLTAIKMDVSWLASRLPPEPPQLAGRVEKLKGAVDTTVASVRRIASDLRPVMLDDLGLLAALENLLHDLSQRTGIVVSLDAEEDGLDLGEPLASSLYRMAQEALTNVARHAEATEVQVAVGLEDGDRLVLTVRDNGKGYDAEVAASRKSYGVLGIRERAYTLGGTVRIERVETGGTVVEIVIPVARYRRKEAGHDTGAAG